MESREELFYGIGIGTLSLQHMNEALKRSSGSRLSWLRKMLRLENKDVEPEREGTEIIIGSSDPGASRFSIASCCNPIPGDPVIGFKAPDGMVTVHKKACPVAESIAATHGDWVVVPKWQEQVKDTSFLVRITLKGIDRVGMLNEISHYVSMIMGVNMRRLTLSAEGGLFEGYIDLYVSSREILDKMIKELTAIEGIEHVSRSEL